MIWPGDRKLETTLSQTAERDNAHCIGRLVLGQDGEGTSQNSLSLVALNCEFAAGIVIANCFSELSEEDVNTTITVDFIARADDMDDYPHILRNLTEAALNGLHSEGVDLEEVHFHRATITDHRTLQWDQIDPGNAGLELDVTNGRYAQGGGEAIYYEALEVVTSTYGDE